MFVRWAGMRQTCHLPVVRATWISNAGVEMSTCLRQVLFGRRQIRNWSTCYRCVNLSGELFIINFLKELTKYYSYMLLYTATYTKKKGIKKSDSISKTPLLTYVHAVFQSDRLKAISPETGGNCKTFRPLKCMYKTGLWCSTKLNSCDMKAFWSICTVAIMIFLLNTCFPLKEIFNHLPTACTASVAQW